jgi:ATP-binding cassette subfamily F protein uup
MNYLALENVTKSYGEQILFEDIFLYINQGEKVALVAKNGTGKSSLINLVMGKESPDSGSVVLHRSIKTGFLEQEPALDERLSVFESVYQSENPVMRAIVAYERALLHPEHEAALNEAISEMERLQAWDYEAKVKTILSQLGIRQLDQKVGSLSGGQRKRVALAKVLIEEPDFLILDEPTNHLDLAMIEWLEEFLARPGITLFMVTHDRYFLEAVCDRIVELDNGQVYKYDGNYSYYLQKKAEREESAVSSTERARNLYVRELDWMRRQPKARGTKAKSRIDAFFDLEKKANRRLDDDRIEIDIQMNRLGSKVIELHNVGKSFNGRTLIRQFDYKIKHKDRIGIVGNNGTGKSTLLNLMTGLDTPDSGKVVIGDTVVLGYYNQSGLRFSEDKRVIDIIKDIAEYIPMKGGKKLYATQLLERFLFDGKKQQTFVYKLSGGEKRRLYLLTILIKNPNVLILDEPTNDLDVATLQVLEAFLEQYEGVVIIVSHDRHFMDKLVEHTFAFEGDGLIRDYPGNYTAYREARAKELAEARQQEKAAAAQPSAAPTASAVRRALSSEAQKELRRLERDLEKLEGQKAELTNRFNDPQLQPQQMKELSQELSKILAQIEDKEMRWLELSENG